MRLSPRVARCALLALIPAAACYRVTVITAPEPANPLVVDKAWSNSFVYGLVPPGEIDVATQCRGGVSKVVTQRSFLNSLVGAITYSIYTPMQVTTTCANSRSAAQQPTLLERLGATPAADSTTAPPTRVR